MGIISDWITKLAVGARLNNPEAYSVAVGKTAAGAPASFTIGALGGMLVEIVSGIDLSTLATHAKQDITNTLLEKIAPVQTCVPATVAAKSDSGILKAEACRLYKVIAANSHASTTVYLQIFDSATVPANATAPRIPSIPIAPGKAIVIDLGSTPLACVAGLSWASSSTVDTKTITAITSLQVSAIVA